METIGELIRKYRKERGLTQVELAKLVNKSPQIISNWERGYTQSIHHDDIAKLSAVLKISPEKIVKTSEFNHISESKPKQEQNKSKPPEVWQDLTESERKQAEDFMRYLKSRRGVDENAASGL